MQGKLIDPTIKRRYQIGLHFQSKRSACSTKYTKSPIDIIFKQNYGFSKAQKQFPLFFSEELLQQTKFAQ